MLRSKLTLELLWIIITIIITVLILLPIYGHVGAAYKFYGFNVFIIVVAVTFCRYIFLLKHHYISVAKWIKVLFIFIPIPIFFFLMTGFYEFQAFSDEQGIMSMLTALPFKEQTKFITYIKTEILLFWTTAIIANALMPVRMIVSLWREINKGTH